MSETNVTIINMQPTTDYVNIGGPLINPSEYATKNEINEKLDNYATVKQATDIARNITDSALENGYYTSSEIDGKLDCKSNTDHTHTDLTLKTLNDMPIIGDNGEFITTYPFIPTVGWYPFNVMQNLDFYNKVKSGYIWRLCAYNDTIFQIVNNGYVRLTIDKYGTYIDKNLRCDTINGINTSDISLNTHNHDDKYALVDHTHDDKYSKLDHTHEYNDIKNNYFQIKLNEVVANEGAYIAYDASEKLKEDLELNPVGMTIRFFENVEIRANASSITIKVGKKEFKFTATGLTNN